MGEVSRPLRSLPDAAPLCCWFCCCWLKMACCSGERVTVEVNWGISKPVPPFRRLLALAVVSQRFCPNEVPPPKNPWESEGLFVSAGEGEGPTAPGDPAETPPGPTWVVPVW